MTQDEFLKAYRQSRKSFNNLNRNTIKKIKEAYIEASNQVAAIIRRSEKLGQSQLTIRSWSNINDQLLKSAEQLQRAITENTIEGMTKGVARGSAINERYLIDIIKDIPGIQITATGIHNVFTNVNNLIVQSVVNRVFTSGYNFATSVWLAGEYYQDTIKNIISAGLAQNRDLLDIARDVQIYTADGKLALAKRYGELLKPAKIFMKRIGNKIDWRAIRIARSELYMSIQEAAREHGRTNPGAIDLYLWVLTAGRTQWNCLCEDYQQNNPYKYKDIPAYPHPNCRCYIRPVLRDRRAFEDDLVKWANGSDIGYLDEWHRDIYLPNFQFPAAA